MPVQVPARLAVALLTLLKKSRGPACGNQASANYSILIKVASVNNYYKFPQYSSVMRKMDYFYHAKVMKSTNETYKHLSFSLMETEVS